MDFQKFLNSSETGLEKFYPQWRRAQIGQETICIPVYHSSVRDYLGSIPGANDKDRKNKESDLRGGNAEYRIFFIFKSLDLGGILIASLDSKAFPKELKTKIADLIMRYNGENDTKISPDFQCDLLFLHPYFGINILEVKAAESLDKHGAKDQTYVKACKQAHDLPVIMRLLWNAIMPEEEFDIPMKSGICYPNCDLSSIQPGCGYVHIDKETCGSNETFRQFWLDANSCREQVDLFARENFSKFIKIIVGLRSIVDLSPMKNALSVARLIQQENFCPKQKKSKKAANVLHASSNEFIFLSNEQLEIAHCQDRLQLITGPPGSGKTLVLLMQLLNVAKDEAKKEKDKAKKEREETKSKLFIASRTSYQRKLEAFLEAHESVFAKHRKPTLRIGQRNFTVEKDDDDIFRDEILMTPDDLDFLINRSAENITGRTICVITNGVTPPNRTDIARFCQDLNERTKSKYKIHELTKVLRGSTNIIRFWKDQLEIDDSSIGHNIECADVDQRIFLTSHEVLLAIFEEINTLLNAGIQSRDIAIITRTEPERAKICTFLATKKYDKRQIYGETLKNFDLGNMRERLDAERKNATENSSSAWAVGGFGGDYTYIDITDSCEAPMLTSAHNSTEKLSIIIDQYSNVLSYEWPFVIACSLSGLEISTQFKLIACSRAMARLTVINRDGLRLQRRIDEKFKAERFRFDTDTVFKMIRRQARLRREYIYRKSMEEKQKLIQEKRDRIKKSIDENRPIPTDLRKEALDLQKGIGWKGEDAEAVVQIDDEYRWAGCKDPKIMITTSRDPSSRLKMFAKEMKLVFPNSQRMNRGHYDVKKLVEACRANEVTDFIIIHEHRGNPDGLIICHLPMGPTAYFNMSNVVMRHDIPDVGTMTEQYPHLIFNNLKSKLGIRTTTILKHLFPVPKDDSKRVVTFANDDDFISFRHHTFKKAEGTEIEMKEIGPRFELKLYCIKLGTLDSIEAAETEWVLKPYMNTTKKRQFLSIADAEENDEE